MSIAAHLKHLEKLAIDNSPALLTAAGVLGTVTGAVLAGRGALKYERITEELIRTQGRDTEGKEKAKLLARCYGPAAMTLCLTVGAIVGSHHIGTRRTAAITSAYIVAQKGFDEYKDKVIEKIGDKKEEALRSEIAQDRLNNNPISESNIVISGNGDVLCYEMLNDRYFRSSMNAIRAAENEVNSQVLNDGYASLTDFYDRIGLRKTSMSEELGWRSDGPLFKVDITGTVSDTGEPALALDYRVQPVRGHYRFHGGDGGHQGVQV